MNKRRIKKGLIALVIFLLIISIMILVIMNLMGSKKLVEKSVKSYVTSLTISVPLYDLEHNEVDKIYRGEEIYNYKYKEKVDETIYTKIKYKDKFYLIDSKYVTDEYKNIIQEKELFVRTSVTLYKENDSVEILSLIKKGERVEIIGFDSIKKGIVNMYKVKYNDLEGYVYSKYLVNTKEESEKLFDENGIQDYMSTMGDGLKGGSAVNLDYYPYDKPKFKDNVMPDEVRSLYLNGAVVSRIDEYIDFAKDNNINALVIDIKDDGAIAYSSPVMDKYSHTSSSHAINSFDDYKEYLKKAKDAGLYVIGRITTFKDSYFVEDHKEVAISNSVGDPFSHNGSYWPSAYNRYVWQYNVELAIEAVKEIGFNEIQFDYVRFPDRTTSLETSGVINLNNTYDEEKAQAIQNFVIYACDKIHEAGAYVSIDVFGESASNYVTAYGQFWAAISNVADVISGMPYPDHFNAHEYGIDEVVWTVPYKLLSSWSKYVVSKQEIIPTPAKVRTWIQTYNSTREPFVEYDASKISEEISALYDNGLSDGYMTWNSGSNLDKYKSVSAAFRKDYK